MTSWTPWVWSLGGATHSASAPFLPTRRRTPQQPAWSPWAVPSRPWCQRLGVVNHHRSLVPRVFQHKPTPRLGAPGIDAEPRNDAAVGRALETLAAAGVTALSVSLPLPPLSAWAWRHAFSSRSPPLPGRSAREPRGRPCGAGAPSPRGSRREHRPALHQVLWARSVEHRAGSPVRMQPRSGHRRDATNCGAVIRAPMDQGPIPSGAPSLGADRARDRAETRQQRAAPPRQGGSRVPATGRAGQAVLAHAAPTTMGPLREDDRSQPWGPTDGGGAQRGLLVDSAQRRAASQRPVDTPWRTHSDPASPACKTRGRPTCAGAAEAHRPSQFPPGLAPPPSPTPRSPLRTTPRGDDRAKTLPPRRGSPRCQAPARRLSPPERPDARRTAGSAWRLMHSRRSGGPRSAAARRHRERQTARGGACCKPHRVAPPRCLATSPSASWRC